MLLLVIAILTLGFGIPILVERRRYKGEPGITTPAADATASAVAHARALHTQEFHA